MAYIGKQPVVGNFQVCDAISVVNGQAAYTMQVGSANVTPETAFHMLVSLNGVLQKPGSSFTISGSTITFASNLATGDVIDFIILLGDVLNIGAPSDDTVYISMKPSLPDPWYARIYSLAFSFNNLLYLPVFTVEYFKFATEVMVDPSVGMVKVSRTP